MAGISDTIKNLGATDSGSAAEATKLLESARQERERQAQMKKEAAEKKKADEAENKRRADELNLFNKLNESGVVGKNYFYDEKSGYISDSKTGKPVSDKTRKGLISNDSVARKNLEHMTNFANSAVYRAGTESDKSPAATAWSLVKSIFSGSKATDSDMAKELNRLVAEGKLLPPEGKKGYDAKDIQSFKDESGKFTNIAQYNGRIVPGQDYQKSVDSAKKAQEATAGTRNFIEEGKAAAKEYFEDAKMTAQKLLSDLKAKGFSADEAKAYLNGIYAEKEGGLTDNAKKAFYAVYPDTQGPNPLKQPEKPSEKPKEKANGDEILTAAGNAANKSVTSEKSEIGAAINNAYSNAVNDDQKKVVEDEVKRFNEGFKSSVDPSYKENLPNWLWNMPEFKEATAGGKAFYIVDAIGTALRNMSRVIKNQDANEKTKLQEIQQEKLKGALDRYNKAQDAMLDEDVNLLKMDYDEAQKFRWQLKNLYANKTLQRAIQSLDIGNRAALLKAYKEVADSGKFGKTPEEIFENMLKIGATQSAMEGNLPQTLTSLVGAAGQALGGAVSTLSGFASKLF